ncbi:universal stress protein [Catalinimonas niigatensis]|uniref:universal stress protein n=1 Tax=Catalinimonas niigatensis TaxID=1397264 RepID=UPI0026659188|nr:universal stress protein [Catalinimonas niigatensis]WPP49793.1 universal stress protein [Catalinimonas niigatensis]
MKSIQRILVPTDFSTTANNALIYALAFAQEVDAEVFILHAYQLPVPPSYHYPVGYYEAVNPEQFKREADKRMGELRHDFLYAPKVTYECITHLGPATDSIESMAIEKNVDLIIMGTRKAEGAKAWFGSVTTDTVKHSKYPVLTIPQDAQFVRPKKIVLATSLVRFNHFDLEVLDTLKTIAQLFEADIDILHVHPENKEYSQEQTNFRETLCYYLGVTTCFNYTTHEDVNEGIQQYLDKNEVDMLVMLPQHHGLLDQLIHASKTKYMIFHTQKPLLALK